MGRLLPPIEHTNEIVDGFNTTKPGPYFQEKVFGDQAKFGGHVGGRMKSHYTLKKRTGHEYCEGFFSVMFLNRANMIQHPKQLLLARQVVVLVPQLQATAAKLAM
jgi:hypothetical protein